MTRSRLPFYAWLLTLVVLVASVIMSSASLPPQVATHFNADGDPDGWMSRSGAMASFLGFSVGMSAFILGLVFCIRFFPASSLNVPRQDFWRTADNYPRACRFLFAHTF